MFWISWPGKSGRGSFAIGKVTTHPRVDAGADLGQFTGMSTVAEIEAALPELSREELCRIEAALRRLQNRSAAEPGGEEPKYRDLDSLIGSWKEDAEFDAAIRVFEQVDEAAAK